MEPTFLLQCALSLACATAMRSGQRPAQPQRLYARWAARRDACSVSSTAVGTSDFAWSPDIFSEDVWTHIIAFAGGDGRLSRSDEKAFGRSGLGKQLSQRREPIEREFGRTALGRFLMLRHTLTGPDITASQLRRLLEPGVQMLPPAVVTLQPKPIVSGSITHRVAVMPELCAEYNCCCSNDSEHNPCRFVNPDDSHDSCCLDPASDNFACDNCLCQCPSLGLRACFAIPCCITGSVVGFVQDRVGSATRILTANYREEHLIDATSEMTRVRNSLKLVMDSLVRELSWDSSQRRLSTGGLTQVQVRLNASENVLIVEKCSRQRAGNSGSDVAITEAPSPTTQVHRPYLSGTRAPRGNTNCIIQTECYHY